MGLQKEVEMIDTEKGESRGEGRGEVYALFIHPTILMLFCQCVLSAHLLPHRCLVLPLVSI